MPMLISVHGAPRGAVAAATFLAALAAIVEPALAGVPAVPGPIVGAGLPVLVVAGGGYLLVRALRKRRRRG